jgi:CheY-like chemotaxis protein
MATALARSAPMPTAIHILVVEDDAACRQAMKGVLEMVGYGVACAANGREALDHLRRAAQPSVILLDLSMPLMTGWEFRHEQQHDPALAGIPVVLLSGEPNLPQIASSLQAASYFSKPVELDGLLESVRFLCGQRPAGPRAN